MKLRLHYTVREDAAVSLVPTSGTGNLFDNLIPCPQDEHSSQRGISHIPPVLASDLKMRNATLDAHGVQRIFNQLRVVEVVPLGSGG